MTMATKPNSHFVTPALLVLSTALAAANWYLRPERAVGWASAMALFGCLPLSYLFTLRRSDRAARRRAADSIRHGIVFAGLMMAVPLSVALAVKLGVIHDADISKRATMVLLGAFFAFTGNAMPKTLTPLSELRCDATRVQAFQRFAGWIWVLTGVVYALIWLVLPLDRAKPISVAVLMGGMLLVAVQLLRLFRARAAG